MGHMECDANFVETNQEAKNRHSVMASSELVFDNGDVLVNSRTGRIINSDSRNQLLQISMALNCLRPTFLFLIMALTISHVVRASDPDITSDFIVPANSNAVDGAFFTHTGLRGIFDGGAPTTFKVTKASLAEFPALNGQSVSFAVLQYPAGGVNPPHTHPRSAELLFVIEGSLEVGLVDTTNKYFNQTLQVGDMFIFPKGLVHYQYNASPSDAAFAVSAFGSANAGTVSVPLSVFTTGIDDGILALAFKTDVATIQKIKTGLVPK
ncbi:hypothetical protein IFM89_000681 [Coptis chinensis]|uniref:Germin-like protein n=1 Tax=Coptis chinensis TaxID=261450 RepID=A0A835IL01_9MAGN|nr:hypothetical protein IFM89_000681 [Coptis chinensis]